jgi:hypothetical protein
MEPTNVVESEATETGADATLPRAANLPAGPKLEGEVERNPIFDALVGSDGGEDVACLVAYSIYKQNKRAWLDNFVKATGRGPSEAETRSYIIGESTERRLATYRRLAASKLAGDAPSRSAWREGANVGNSRRRGVGASDHRRAGGGRPRYPRQQFRRREIVSAPASSGVPRARARCRANGSRLNGESESLSRCRETSASPGIMAQTPQDIGTVRTQIMRYDRDTHRHHAQKQARRDHTLNCAV